MSSEELMPEGIADTSPRPPTEEPGLIMLSGRRESGVLSLAAAHGRSMSTVEIDRLDPPRTALIVVDGQVSRAGVALIARAPLPVLTPPRPEDTRTEPLPGPRVVQGVVTAAVGRSCVDGAATTRPARHNAASRAELHGSRRVRAVADLTL